MSTKSNGQDESLMRGPRMLCQAAESLTTYMKYAFLIKSFSGFWKIESRLTTKRVRLVKQELVTNEADEYESGVNVDAKLISPCT